MSDLDDEPENQRGEDVRGKSRGGRGHSRTDGGGNKRIQEALIIAAIIALIGAVWTLRESVAVLRTAQDFQQRQIDRLDRRQDTLEGRIVRGGPDAIDQQ